MESEFQQLEERKRAELREAFAHNDVSDPVSILVSLAISAAVSAATYGLGLLLAPKPQRQKSGGMSGDLFIPRSEQGILIPEIYGADPFNDAAVWAATTAYSLNALIKPLTYNGRVYKVTTAGTSGGSEPTWPTAGNTVANGSVVFTDIGKRGGGCRISAIFIWTSGIRKLVTVTRQETGGGKGGGKKTQEVENTSYDIDLAALWCRGEARLLKEWANTEVIYTFAPLVDDWTGIINPGTPPDDDYDPRNPPDPRTDWGLPKTRFDYALDIDAYGVSTGTTAMGSYSDMATYPGNLTQLPDPTIEAETDAEYGAGSTPAYRRRCFTVHKNFSLTRFGNFVPALSGLLENLTLKTLETIPGDLCSRVGLAGTDYDFTGLAQVRPRGIRVSGRRFRPREILQSLEPVFNIYYTEIDGKLYGRTQGSSVVAGITDDAIGWIEGESEDESTVLPELDSVFENEIRLPKDVTVKYFDPETEYEPNSQIASRQITTGVQQDLLEVEITMTAEEARAVAQRELYDRYVKGTVHRFTVSWEYLWWNPGDIVPITRDEGFVHSIQLTSIKGGIGVLECEGVAVETSVFTQPQITIINGQFEVPPAGIPTSQIVFLLDCPLLRDLDNTINNGVGFYAVRTPRTSTGLEDNGASLYVSKVGWERIADMLLPGTMGRAATVLASVTDPTVWDEVSTVDVDLYGTAEGFPLESAAALDVLNGKNWGMIGDEVIAWKTATLQGGQPNRWRLSGLLRGRRGTQTTDHVVDERFVLLNEAVQFIPINLGELNQERDYRCVSSGQSLDDAATVQFTWTGGTIKPLPPTHVKGTRDANGSLLIEWVRQARVGAPSRDFTDSPLAEETERYIVEIYSGSTLKRTVGLRAGRRDSEPVRWRRWGGEGALTFDVEGTLSMTGSALNVAIADQLLDGDFVLEYGANSADDDVPNGIWLQRAGQELLGVPPGFFVSRSGTLNNDFVTIGDTGPETDEGIDLTYPARLFIVRNGSEIKAYLNEYTQTSTPVWVSSPEYTGTFSLIAFANSIGASVQLYRPRVARGPVLHFHYTDQMQILDFGSTQASVKVRLYQENSLVGRGSYTEATI